MNWRLLFFVNQVKIAPSVPVISLFPTQIFVAQGENSKHNVKAYLPQKHFSVLNQGSAFLCLLNQP